MTREEHERSAGGNPADHARDAEVAELKRRVAAGEYVVDPHAVAAAIVERSRWAADADRVLAMLVAAELDRESVRREQDEPGAGGHGSDA